jgi:hypothetical protein
VPRLHARDGILGIQRPRAEGDRVAHARREGARDGATAGMLRSGGVQSALSGDVQGRSGQRGTLDAPGDGERPDEPLGPETEETREVVQPKIYKQRIRLGRRAGVKI